MDFAMKCEICNSGMSEGVDIYRVNETDEPAIWRCWNDMTVQQRDAIDPELKALVDALKHKSQS